MKRWFESLKIAFRFLCFRASADELAALDKHHLVLGLLFVWLAGVGRHWDDESAGLLQSSGAGSLIYVFILAGYLWFALLPMRPCNWRYTQVLTAICLTAPPGLIYAIPVERWLEAGTAREVNLWALVVVAVWRVALFVFFTVRGARLKFWRGLVGTLFPLCVIVCILGFFVMVASIADSMAGTRAPKSDEVTRATGFILAMSFYSFLPLLLAYLWAASEARRE